MRWIVVPMVCYAAYVLLSQGVSTELQQWNPNAPMPAIGGLSGKEIKARIEFQHQVLRGQRSRG